MLKAKYFLSRQHLHCSSVRKGADKGKRRCKAEKWSTPAIRLRPEMPTGPLNRVVDNVLAKKLLGWEPKSL